MSEQGGMDCTCRHNKNHSILLARQLFASSRQLGVADGNERETRRRLLVVGDLKTVSSSPDLLGGPVIPCIQVFSSSCLCSPRTRSTSDACLRSLAGRGGLRGFPPHAHQGHTVAVYYACASPLPLLPPRRAVCAFPSPFWSVQ